MNAMGDIRSDVASIKTEIATIKAEFMSDNYKRFVAMEENLTQSMKSLLDGEVKSQIGHLRQELDSEIGGVRNRVTTVESQLEG